MTRPDRATRRSGDPRRRVAQTAPQHTRGRTRVVIALAGCAALAALAFVALRSTDAHLDDRARDHAEVACGLTSKAEEAARVNTGGRYAAAVLLLDQAMIESARAVESDPALAELDQSVQAVHAAGHTGDPGQWESALVDALTTCRATLR